MIEWQVTVPAGQTRSLMHFLVQAEPGSAALSDLSGLTLLVDAHALEGLSADERASIVNFVVPE